VCPALALACAKVGGDGPGGGGGGSGSGHGGSSATTGAGGQMMYPGQGGHGGSSGAGGSDYADTDAGRCGYQNFNLERKPAEVMLVLDRSASMKDDLQDQTPTGPNDPTKWSQVIPALVQVVTQAGSDVSWGLKTFPEDGSECAAGTVTNKIDVPIAPMNGAAVAAAIMAVTPEGNGTPTSAAVAVASTYLQSVQTDNHKFLLLATDGQPSCYRSGSSLAKGTDQAKTDAVSAVTTAAMAGYKTFVVGVATKPSDDATLNALATAGLEPRNDPNPLATKYYLAATQQDLVAALSAIVGSVSTCVFPFSTTPPDPTKIAVKVSGSAIPQDTTHANGWDYLDATHMGLQVYGSSCDMIKTAAANMVEIIFGCPDLPPPT
jgi:hypothetical protein